MSDSKNSVKPSLSTIVLGILLLLLGISILASLVWNTPTFIAKLSAAIISAPLVAAAIVTGGVTIIVMIRNQQVERKRAIERELRDKKIPVYEKLLSFWFDEFSDQKMPDDKKRTEEQRIEFYRVFTPTLIVWGNVPVIKAYLALKNIRLTSMTRNPQNLIDKFEQLLLTIREDLGQSNKKLEPYDLIRLFIEDVDKMITAQTSDKNDIGSDPDKKLSDIQSHN